MIEREADIGQYEATARNTLYGGSLRASRATLAAGGVTTQVDIAEKSFAMVMELARQLESRLEPVLDQSPEKESLSAKSPASIETSSLGIRLETFNCNMDGLARLLRSMNERLRV